MFSLSTLPDLTPRDVRLPTRSHPAPILYITCLVSLLTTGPIPPSQPHSLWYTARHAPSAAPHHNLLQHPHDPTNGGGGPSPSPPTLGHHHHDGGAPHHHNHNHPSRDPRDRNHRRALVERTALAHLRHDEQVMDRRRENVAGYGSAWLKPAGVPKTLFQLREERRELEEQAEAHRREALLQAQLAEAEGAAAAGVDGDGGGGGGGADGMTMLADEDDDLMGAGAEEGEEVQDLDDEIPEAEGFGFDGEESDEEEEEEDDEEDEEEDDDETLSESEGGQGEDNARAVQFSPAEEEQQVRDMRAAEDRLRQMMAREQDGGSDVGDAFRDGEGSREGLLEEDDLVHIRPSADDTPAVADISIGMDMDMDADLDEGIPEAYDDDDGGLYEHTDSDEGISDDDGTRELSFAGRSSIGAGMGGGAGHAVPGSSSRLRRSVHGSVRRASLRSRGDRVSLAQSDMDISGLLSNNDSSFLADSPYARRGGS